MLVSVVWFLFIQSSGFGLMALSRSGTTILSRHSSSSSRKIQTYHHICQNSFMTFQKFGKFSSIIFEGVPRPLKSLGISGLEVLPLSSACRHRAGQNFETYNPCSLAQHDQKKVSN